MRKWIANCHAKGILSAVPKCDLAACLEEVNIGSDPLPDSGALGLMWNPQKDELRVNCKEFASACTKREMTKQLASQFDPMGIVSPFLLGGKLLLQRVATSGVDWDEVLPMEVQECWNKWLETLQLIRKVSIPRNCFPGNLPFNHDAVKFQLHAFCDASNSAFSCVIFLRCWFNDRVEVKFMIGKCRVVLTSQANWIISRKELEAAKICNELMLQVENALSHLNCSKHFWTDSKVVLGCITNSDLNLSRLVKRRIDRILRVASSGAWKYVNTSENPADIDTRDGAYKRSESIDFWLQGPSFLLQQQVGKM